MAKEEQKNPNDFGVYINFLKEVQTHLKDTEFDNTVMIVDYQPSGYVEEADIKYKNPEDIKEEFVVPHAPDTITLLSKEEDILFGLNVPSNEVLFYHEFGEQKKAVKEIAKKYNIDVKDM